ncbi:MAG: Pullulanase, type [Actinomycetota bacterium]
MSRFLSIKSLVAFVAVLGIFLTGSLNSGVASAAGLPSTIQVTVHYNRGDADYSNWKIYTWKNIKSNDPLNADNGRTALSSTDSFGGVYVVNATGMSTFNSLGFLVTYQNSWTKDFATDRFISSFTNGKAEIWLRSGDATIYTSEPAPPAPAIASATLSSFNKFRVIVSPAIAVTSTTTEGFTISDGTSDVPVTAATAINASGGNASIFDLTIGSNADLAKTYTVSHAGLTSEVASTAGLYDSQAFADAFTYSGNDLGNTYNGPASTDFRVWAPTATAVSIMKHTNAAQSPTMGTELPMTKDVKGTWVYHFEGDANGMIYDYKVHVNGDVNYASDPYARSSTIDSGHSVVVNLDQSDPSGWSTTVSPDFGSGNTDATIYELHVRDLSSNANSGIPVAHRKKYLGLTDLNTSYSYQTSKVQIVKGQYKTVVTKYSTPTGISAIKALGVTHVEFLPVYDFNNLGEGGSESDPPFNWGYDPVNYNVPDGGYSSDPTNPYTRITELKQAIQTVHTQGMRTIMDVVYNHVSDASAFSQEQIVPGYFFRRGPDGALTSASGCGNDVNSERSMVRKFIVDSVLYWAKEYHFDGFRFDLMGLLDVTTMNQIRAGLDVIDPKILVIGEGWNMGTATEPANQLAASKLPNIAFFNDQIRDATKGSVFNAGEKGFVQGNTASADSVIAGIVGQTNFGGRTSANWLATSPGQSVNYVEAHDNLTLWDKLSASMNGSNKATRMLAANRQAAAIVFTSQGVPFMQAGQEFLRTKNGDDNSYASSDSVNGINWTTRAVNASTVNYYAGLIALRKAHPAFRMKTAAAINSNIAVSTSTKNVIRQVINGTASGDSWKQIVVLHNANSSAVTISLPSKATWYVVVNGTSAGVKTLATLKSTNKVVVPAMTSLVLRK